MSNVIINDSVLTSVADAIRTKNGTSDTYLPSEMATAIGTIPSGGAPLDFSTLQRLDITPSMSIRVENGIDLSPYLSSHTQVKFMIYNQGKSNGTLTCIYYPDMFGDRIMTVGTFGSYTGYLIPSKDSLTFYKSSSWTESMDIGKRYYKANFKDAYPKRIFINKYEQATDNYYATQDTNIVGSGACCTVFYEEI